MTTTTALTIAALVMLIAFALFVFSLMRGSARSERMAQRQRQDLLMRYEGGDPPCVICGEPSRYSLNGKPVHPGPCRRALEAQLGKGAAA